MKKTLFAIIAPFLLMTSCEKEEIFKDPASLYDGYGVYIPDVKDPKDPEDPNVILNHKVEIVYTGFFGGAWVKINGTQTFHGLNIQDRTFVHTLKKGDKVEVYAGGLRRGSGGYYEGSITIKLNGVSRQFFSSTGSDYYQNTYIIPY